MAAMNEALKKEIDYLQLRTKCLGDQVAELFKPPATNPNGSPVPRPSPCPPASPPVSGGQCGPCVPCGPCFVKIPEVHPTGSYIKILNTSCYKTECLSGCFLVQMRCGKYVTMYTFPPCVYIYPQGTIRVWSCAADPGYRRLLNDLVFKELRLWCSGSDVTTLLCRCDGAAITWLVGCGVSCTSGCCSPRVCPC